MNIIEYGGGESTYLINQLLKELNYGGKVIGFESEQEWLEDHNSRGYNVDNIIQLAPVELIDAEQGICKYIHSYEGLENTDFVILDGPDYRKYLTTTNCPSNITINLEDLVKLKGEEIPFFIDGRAGCVRYYVNNCKYSKYIAQETRE